MTVIPLASFNLKNASHLHGVGSTTSTVRTGEKVRAVLILETGALVITVKVKSKGPGNALVDKTYMLHIGDTYYVEPEGEAWLTQLLPPTEKPRAAIR